MCSIEKGPVHITCAVKKNGINMCVCISRSNLVEIRMTKGIAHRPKTKEKPTIFPPDSFQIVAYMLMQQEKGFNTYIKLY